MEIKTNGVFLLLLGISFVQDNTADNELKLDQALLTVFNYLPERIVAFSESDGCYKCLPQPLLVVPPASTGSPSNMSTVVSSHFALTIKVFTEANAIDPVCRWRTLYGEQGQFSISVELEPSEENATKVSCNISVEKDPVDGYIRHNAKPV